jgi:hypothetical protein
MSERLHHKLHSRHTWLCNLGEVWNESSIIANKPKKTLYLRHRCWWLPIQYISHLARVHHDSFRCYYVAQEWHYIDPEFTHSKLVVKLVLSQSLKHDSKVLFMFFHTLQIYKNVTINTTTNMSHSGMNIEFMRYMKCAITFINPNDIMRYT